MGGVKREPLKEPNLQGLSFGLRFSAKLTIASSIIFSCLLLLLHKLSRRTSDIFFKYLDKIFIIIESCFVRHFIDEEFI